MKTMILLFLLSPVNVTGLAQNDIHKQTVDTLLKQLNDNNFEEIYQSFSPKMQQFRTKKYFFQFFSKLKIEQGTLLFLELYDYRSNSRNMSTGIYNGQFEIGRSRVTVTVDSQGKITGLYFKKETAF